MNGRNLASRREFVSSRIVAHNNIYILEELTTHDTNIYNYYIYIKICIEMFKIDCGLINVSLPQEIEDVSIFKI